jgi:plastocyanin
MIATALALAVTLAPASQSVDIAGQVKLSNGRNASLAAVWLEGTTKSKPLTKAVVDQRDRTFIPHVSVVTVGTTVQFPNNDTVLHNVFADYNAKVFDLKSYPRGVSRPMHFEKKGLVVLLCNMHSEMGAFIVVVDTPYYSVADPKGAFTVKDVPPGKYVVHGWHESNQVFEQEMTIGSGTRLDITLARKKR